MTYILIILPGAWPRLLCQHMQRLFNSPSSCMPAAIDDDLQIGSPAPPWSRGCKLESAEVEMQIVAASGRNGLGGSGLIGTSHSRHQDFRRNNTVLRTFAQLVPGNFDILSMRLTARFEVLSALASCAWAAWARAWLTHMVSLFRLSTIHFQLGCPQLVSPDAVPPSLPPQHRTSCC